MDVSRAPYTFRRRLFARMRNYWRVIGLACGIVFSLCPQVSPQTNSSNATRTEVPLQLILVRSREEATRLLDRLKKGEDFAQLAKERSIDPTATDRGFLGVTSLSSLRLELRNAVSGLGEGNHRLLDLEG